jgi:hypothetical protein
MIIAPTMHKPATSNQIEPVLLESMALSVPNKATRVKVRNPAFADGLRSRSRPISKPIARLVRNYGSASMPLPCRNEDSITNSVLRLKRQLALLGAQVAS